MSKLLLQASTWLRAPHAEYIGRAPTISLLYMLRKSTTAQLCCGMFSDTRIVAANPKRSSSVRAMPAAKRAIRLKWTCVVIATNIVCMLIYKELARHLRVALARCALARGRFCNPNCENFRVAEKKGSPTVKRSQIENDMCNLALNKYYFFLLYFHASCVNLRMHM